jgi:flagellar biosynthetic protein FlhB
MAEQNDKESKTEEASDKKIRDALEKGNVPTSREASTLATFIAIFIAGSFLLSGSIIQLQNALISFIDSPGAWQIKSSADAVALLHIIIADISRFLAPIILLLLFAGVSAALLQNPPQLATERIKPKLSNISLAKGLKRILGMQGLVEFGKSLFKLIAVATVGLVAARISQFDVLASMFTEPVIVPKLLQDVILRLVGWVALLSLALVAADIVWARYKWRYDLRMTKHEVKDELKQTQGDPQIKARIRTIARDRARKRMIAAVPRATLVITNPTHFAIALRYVREEGGAPMVLAKGKDFIALKIREVAEQHGVPIVEDKPLARSLYDNVEVDKLIPSQFYRAVAEIIYYLHLRKSRKPVTGGTKN